MDKNQIVPALLVAAAWCIREVAGAVLRRATARSGRIGYVPERAQVQLDVTLDNGDTSSMAYVPGKQVNRQARPRFHASGHAFNDTDVALMLKEPRLTIWDQAGVQVTFASPTVAVDGVATRLVNVPAHGASLMSIEVPLEGEEILKRFSSTVALLTFEKANGGVLEFFLAANVLPRDPMVAWDARASRVVVAGTPEWISSYSYREHWRRLAYNRRSRP